jgi:hypothetical protein
MMCVETYNRLAVERRFSAIASQFNGSTLHRLQPDRALGCLPGRFFSCGCFDVEFFLTSRRFILNEVILRSIIDDI